jgi:NAD(P)-dependent dehydrogenase (short-subunit alcohol dehydrogenase family)
MSKIAVITGGASGIGEATARRFAAAGWAVEIGDRDALRGQAVASELGGVYSLLDVASEGSVNAFAAQAVDHSGYMAKRYVAALGDVSAWCVTTAQLDGMEKDGRTYALSLLAPDRAARLVSLQARGADGVTLPELIDALMAASWSAKSGDAALLRVVQKAVLDGLMILGASSTTAPEARALALQTLDGLAKALPAKGGDALGAAFNKQTAADISAYLADPAGKAPKSVGVPWGKGPRSRNPLPPGPPL